MTSSRSYETAVYPLFQLEWMLYEYSSGSTYLPPADIVIGSIVPTFTELSLLTNILILETSSERDVIEIYVFILSYPNLDYSNAKSHNPQPHLLKPCEQCLCPHDCTHHRKWKTLDGQGWWCVHNHSVSGRTRHRNIHCLQFRYFEFTLRPWLNAQVFS